MSFSQSIQHYFKFISLIIFLLANFVYSKNTPVVLWHGMGDSCCNPNTMGWIQDLIKSVIPDVYIYSVQLGANAVDVNFISLILLSLYLALII